MKNTVRVHTPAPALNLRNNEGDGQTPYFPVDLVVSRAASGEVASRFGDAAWDMGFMSTDGSVRQTLHFYKSDEPDSSDLANRIRQQQKALMWLHIDAGKLRAWVTLRNTNLALGKWCAWAEHKGVDLYGLLSNPLAVAEYSKELNVNYVWLTSSVIRTLWRHRQQLGAPMDLHLQVLRQALNIESSSRKDYRQTPLIPSRVYCAILGALNREMDQIEAELDVLLEAYATGRQVSSQAPDGLTQAQRYSYRARQLQEVAHGMQKLGYDPKQGETLDNFIVGRINQHQMTLILAVVAYTGMRKSEVCILPLDNCLKPFEFLGSTHYELTGSTHKLNQGVKCSASWVTSREGVRATQLAQRIGRVIAEHHDTPAPQGQQPLLFGAVNKPYRKKTDKSFHVTIVAARLRLCPVIGAQDMVELDRLELERGWERDGIEVGQPWPLALHQLRRSLAVYAHRSGMVSLPALKAQLQHITQEMSAYYAAGFSKATNLVFDQQHISHAWQAAKAESSYFAYVLGLLFSDDEIMGQGATRLADVVERRTKEETLALFEQGKLAYRETVLGGCISTEACKTDPLDPIPYDCLETNCVNMVVLGKRLDLVIKSQESAVAVLQKTEPGSVEHRMEARTLEVLLKARCNLKKEAI